MERNGVGKASENSLRTRYPVYFFFLCTFLLLAGCGGGTTDGGALLSSPPNVEYLPVGDGTKDLPITSEIHVLAGKIYAYQNVNIYSGGKLIFDDVAPEEGNLSLVETLLYRIKKAVAGAAARTETQFWAKSILVENGGSLIAGSEEAPFQSVLVFHLYGSNAETKGIECKTTHLPNAYCGVPAGKWDDHEINYESLPDEKLVNDHLAYFGRKVLGVSYGGALQLFGAKGMTKGSIADAGSASGKSWARLNATAAVGETASRSTGRLTGKRGIRSSLRQRTSCPDIRNKEQFPASPPAGTRASSRLPPDWPTGTTARPTT
jgi:hypothetical protein